MAVNAGKKQAVRFLQHELLPFIVKTIKTDGIIGPKTLAAIQEAVNTYPSFPNHFVKARIGFYFIKCEQKPVKFKYLKGWILRSLKHIER